MGLQLGQPLSHVSLTVHAEGVIDHQSIAKSKGLDVPANTALLIGLRSFEAPMIKDNPAGSQFVPLTVAVSGYDQITCIAYWNPYTDFKNNLGSLSKGGSKFIQFMVVDLIKIIQGAL